jgi:hypothetical protein
MSRTKQVARKNVQEKKEKQRFIQKSTSIDSLVFHKKKKESNFLITHKVYLYLNLELFHSSTCFSEISKRDYLLN